VAAESTPGVLDDPSRLLDAQAHVAGAERDHEIVTQRPLAVVDRLVDDVGHPDVALQACRGGAVGTVAVTGSQELHPGHQVGQHDLLDAGLAQRRQDPFDVPQEHPVGTDDEDALVLEWETMRVEQVGRPVQRDDRLAGAGATLHDEHAVLRGADDLVLLALDGGDDVTERAGAPALERCEQGGVPAQTRAVAAFGPDARRSRRAVQALVVADTEVALAEELVLDAQQLGSIDGEVAPPQETHRATPVAR
jgi:hypothetical protein